MQRFLTFWLPPIAWTTVILTASSDVFSSAHTGTWLDHLLRTITGHQFQATTLATANLVIRKCGHVTAYGILGVLNFLALRGERSGWRFVWAIGAVLLASSVASIDEIHQSFIPSRTGRWQDVALDAAAAALAQCLLRATQVLPFRSS
jgi:VanZ family protein